VPISLLVWLLHSLFEPDLFEDNIPPIYLINLPWKLGLRLGLDLKLYYFSIFFTENKESEHLVFCEFHGQ